MYNPSLRQEPRYEPATVIPLKQDSSLLDWLESTGRLIERESEDKESTLEEDVEISELMEVEDHLDYDDDDDLGIVDDED